MLCLSSLRLDRLLRDPLLSPGLRRYIFASSLFAASSRMAISNEFTDDRHADLRRRFRQYVETNRCMDPLQVCVLEPFQPELLETLRDLSSTSNHPNVATMHSQHRREDVSIVVVVVRHDCHEIRRSELKVAHEIGVMDDDAVCRCCKPFHRVPIAAFVDDNCLKSTTGRTCHGTFGNMSSSETNHPLRGSIGLHIHLHLPPTTHTKLGLQSQCYGLRNSMRKNFQCLFRDDVLEASATNGSHNRPANLADSISSTSTVNPRSRTSVTGGGIDALVVGGTCVVGGACVVETG